MSYLVLERLCRRFGSYLAVDDMSLTVEKGSFISLLGPSGCGKTTSLQMIAGFIQPTSGAIRLASQDLLRVKPNRRGLGVVFQNYALFPHMTAAENIAFGLEMLRLPRSERDQRVQEALKLVGLEGFADRYPRRLSGGQQQRVALARALAIEPRILLLDEPMSNLDAKLREEMQIELRQIQRTLGTTTILVTHDQIEALALSDRIVVMNNGRVEQVGEPHEVYERPASAFVASFLGKTNLLPAPTRRIDRHNLSAIGDGRQPVNHAPGNGVMLSIRPEKIRFVTAGADGIGGAIRTRIFQGSYWLYQVDTPCGLVTVIRQNSGEAAPKEGETVGLSWRDEDMTLRSMAGSAG